MLDEIDRALIHALQVAGRAPYSRIGAVLGVSTQTVARRYQRLRAEAGLRVIGLPDPHRAGRSQWLVRLTATPRAAQDLASALSRRSDTSWIKLASGGTEIVAIVHTTPADGNTLLLHDIPRTTGITSVSAHYLLHLYVGGPTAWGARATTLTPTQERALSPERLSREPRSAERLSREPISAEPRSAEPRSAEPRSPEPRSPEPRSRERRSPGPRSRERRSPGPRSPESRSRERGSREPFSGVIAEVLPTDQKLLTALGTDGRATIADLAGQTGWAPATVARRLADLEASGAIFFDVDVDPNALGATTAAMLWLTVPPAHADAAARALAQHDELAFVAATTGRTNLVAHALCPSPDALHTYLTDRVGAIEHITALETVPILRTVKSAAPSQAGPRA